MHQPTGVQYAWLSLQVPRALVQLLAHRVIFGRAQTLHIAAPTLLSTLIVRTVGPGAKTGWPWNGRPDCSVPRAGTHCARSNRSVRADEAASIVPAPIRAESRFF
jgi:hypothetical protein